MADYDLRRGSARRTLWPLCLRRRTHGCADASRNLARARPTLRSLACRSAAEPSSDMRRPLKSAAACSSAHRVISRGATTAPASSATMSGSVRKPFSTHATSSWRIMSAGVRARRSWARSIRGFPADVPIVRTDLEIKPVRIGAWADIGTNATILPGVTIGKGAIVGAGAVVTSDVEPFAVVAGVPAKFLHWRTDSDDIRNATQGQGDGNEE